MCTVSFVPNARGFYVAMNRDEKRSRSTAIPPAIRALGKRHAVFPCEPNGGTWIAANDAGVCLALINWHRIEREPASTITTRGNVVTALAGNSSVQEIAATIAGLPLQEIRPFRLIAIVPRERTVTEWRWNLERLSARKHEWQPQHWFSSGFDERTAELERRRICEAAQDRQSNGSLAWLRRLHRSHAPARGPFSICMHRADAATVSYTEVAVSVARVTMRYKDGPPCSPESTVARTLPCAFAL